MHGLRLRLLKLFICSCLCRSSWLVDKSRIATKIKSASGASGKVLWKSNPTRACPNCQHVIDNSDVAQEWPGLPKGVKFDPSDQEIISHLLAKVGSSSSQPHPFIDEFIANLEVDEGICYTHPKHLPGVKQDGSATHFFHRSIKAYTTGNRKRRKINYQDDGDVRWHKTGKTKPVISDGVQKGCKKIMVLYMTNSVRGVKSEKTNWVMHQYHLGTDEDEKEGEYVISKVFYQQQQVKFGEKDDHDDVPGTNEATVVKSDPVTLEPPHSENRCSDLDMGEKSHQIPQFDPQTDYVEEDKADCEEIEKTDVSMADAQNNGDGEQKWWDSESQNLLDSQQLVEALALCDDLLHSQSSNKDDENGEHKEKLSLSIYAHLGPEHLKKDIEECQNLTLDPANTELETPPSEFRLSQLVFPIIPYSHVSQISIID
ncbi:hypothetical protein PIB30_014522 [Stylosanthes scabra]|uniref:NAC domain-containing protein n=1 Tax=Stylosanthes scabra TaxID=79078 RepID=A0ABU6Y792_9FABA|nr:hypothetical protein [Stylosanthes scabra]